MKKLVKTLLLTSLCACLFIPSVSLANDCPEKKSAKKEIDITVNKVFVEHNMAFMHYTHQGKKSVRINYGDMKTFEKYLGKKVKMQYVDVQYFDEHDGECVQEKSIVKIGNSKLSQ